ncbi:MAG: GGDEF domain-containing protein [Sphaerochaeta sp.]|nr:GGDEF domain-containing protein [Sphaerochaeta sp.]
MNDLIENILRGSVSSVMYVILLFTLTKARFGRKVTIIVATFAFVVNISSTLWFYVYGDLTGLSRFTILLFIVVGLALKPLTRQTFMQWCFTFLTTVNIAMMIIILSFHLGRLFPTPQYANTVFRLLLYILVIFLFERYLLTFYQSIVNNWPMFSVLMIAIFLNLSYFFYATDDIKNTLAMYRTPLLFLVSLSVAAYGTLFYSLKKIITMYDLEMENLKIQKESGRLQKAKAQLEQYANYDTLTGLPNRRFFFDTLERIVAESEKAAGRFVLLYIDLDGFKDINDNYGHEVGDTVLIEVGNRLVKHVRETDFVARLGGDEFAIIFRDIEDMKSAVDITENIHTILQEPMHIGTLDCSINSSIGLAAYPDTAKESETLVRDADSAMYGIKRNGKGGYGIFMN